jgi:hypothetical protein
MNARNDQSAANDDVEDSGSRPWSRRKQVVGAIIWSSFLAACLASLLFFAFVDPVTIIDETPLRGSQPSSLMAYAIGFYFFWMVCAVAAALAAYLLETLPRVAASGDTASKSHD